MQVYSWFYTKLKYETFSNRLIRTNPVSNSKDKKLDKNHTSKVRIENWEYIQVQDKWDVAIKANEGTKIISDVLYMPDINWNLLSVG